jgi:hypothetical protein
MGAFLEVVRRPVTRDVPRAAPQKFGPGRRAGRAECKAVVQIAVALRDARATA